MSLLVHAPRSYDHAVFEGVTWDDYERILQEIGDGSTRVSFLDGVMEIMSPLPEHDTAKSAFGDLIAALSEELRIRRKSFGSTTFRREKKQAGTEPDECFYFNEIDSVRGMKQFDPKVHRPPDLAVEVDVMNSSVPREAILARLGVPEIWRYKRGRITVRILSGDKYASGSASKLFPMLRMDQFAEFVQRMIEDDETQTLLDFRQWVRKLAR
jgi:Uma2 family endonuclease